MYFLFIFVYLITHVCAGVNVGVSVIQNTLKVNIDRHRTSDCLVGSPCSDPIWSIEFRIFFISIAILLKRD